MKRQVIALAVLTLIGLLSFAGYKKMTTKPTIGQLWADWKVEHKKEYGLRSEHDKRFTIFQSNHKYIEEINAQGLSYTLGHNQFSDLTNEEFRAAYHGYKHVERKQKNVKLFDTTSTPSSVNWVTKGAVNAVQNQGSCGSCWAFSAVVGMEGAEFVKTGKLLKLSEQQLVDCDTKQDQGCNGGLMDNAFTYAETNKMDLESAYPYEGRGSFFGCYSKKYTGQVEVASFHDVKSGSEAQLMAAVAQQPVSIAIEADQMSFQLYNSGVFTGSCGTNLDHGVAAVGYGTDSATGKDYWLVRNSWGASWGESGYIRLERGTTVNKGMGQCGILKQPSYPTMQWQ